MYTRLLLESLRRGTRRKLLAVSAVALGTLGATALGEVMLASGDRLAAELASYGANLQLVPGPGQAVLATSRLAQVRHIFWRNNIVAMAPLYPLRLRLSPAPPPAAATPAPLVAEVVGTWFHQTVEPGWATGLPATRPTLRVDGRWPRDEMPAGDATVEVVLGRRLAARLEAAAGGPVAAAGSASVVATGGATAGVVGAGAAAPAHSVAVLADAGPAATGAVAGLPAGLPRRLWAALGSRAVPLAVVGVVTSGGDEDDQAFVPLAVVAGLAGRPGSFLRAEIYAQTNPESANVRNPATMTPREYETWYCTAYPSSVAFQLQQALPEARAEVLYGVTGATADVLGRLRGVLLALAVVSLAGAAVGVTAAMTATVLERRLEAGLLVAIGEARGRVVLFFLSEAALLGGCGGLAGGVLGLAAGRLLGAGALRIAVPWTPVLLPFAVAMGLAVAVTASVLPVFRALGRYPAELLKRATA